MLKRLSVLIALMAWPALAETVEIETYRGSVHAPAAPTSIAVFDVSALDSLDALGIKPNAVIDPIFVDYLDAAKADAEIVGSLFEPDLEALAALRPDLIIAGGRSSEAVPDLAKLAPTIDMTIWEDVVGQGLDRLASYGEIFGKEDEAAALIAGFNAKLAATKDAVTGHGTALIVMTVGPKISAYGAGGRFGWLHTAIGLPEAVENVEATTHGEAVSFEFIRDANPDILIVVDRLAAIGRPGKSARTTLDNALVQETNAWKDGKVIYLDSAPLYIAGGGIQSMNMTLDQIMNVLESAN